MNNTHRVLTIGQIEEDPKNYRKKYTGIDKLADSISTYGLLQNLVVREYEPEKFRISAGNRRRLAILALVESKRWPADHPVHCIVITTFGDFEAVVENTERENPPIWDIAAQCQKWYDQGLDQTQIGFKLGKHQTVISDYLQIHRGLGPKVRRALVNLLPQQLTHSQVLKISRAIDPDTEEPREELQLELLAEFLGSKKNSKRVRKPPNRTNEILRRLEHLESTTVPLHAQAYVDTVVQYLKGEKRRLHFKHK